MMIGRIAAMAVLTVFAGPAALADSATGLGPHTIAGDGGAAIYQHVCQGCHMPGGTGAVGAGAFPRLAGNPKLEQAGYPIAMVLNGHGGMPWFCGMLDDSQIADVVNFVRTHFGNNYTDAVSVADVAASRTPSPTMEK
jgi:mono/diheme cytochrome c family protein